MRRHIKPLFNFEPPATDDEIHAAFGAVRAQDQRLQPAVAGERGRLRPRRRRGRAGVACRLLASLVTNAQPRDRAIEAEKPRERSRLRFAPPASRAEAPEPERPACGTGGRFPLPAFHVLDDGQPAGPPRRWRPHFTARTPMTEPRVVELIGERIVVSDTMRAGIMAELPEINEYPN